MDITKCTKCGSHEFRICETLIHAAKLQNDGLLEGYSMRDNSIEAIICAVCLKEYDSSEFKDIQFNG